jgi:hypothetical protein
MAEPGNRPARRGAARLSDLVGKALEPVVAKRGFATADLIANWPDIAGPALAPFTQPEKILWPRDTQESFAPGTLVLRAEGPRAVFVQHEAAQIRERINSFFGFAAIAQIRIMQAPITRKSRTDTARHVQPVNEPALAATVAPVEDDALRQALERLGRAVMEKPIKQA